MYATPTKNPCTNPTMGTNLIRVPKRNMISRATTNGRAKNNSMDALPRRQEQSLSAGIGKVLAVEGARGAGRGVGLGAERPSTGRAPDNSEERRRRVRPPRLRRRDRVPALRQKWLGLLVGHHQRG